jgi:hypothetical protein
MEINKNDAFNVEGNKKNTKKIEMFGINKNSINIERNNLEEDKKEIEGEINRKRTVIDTVVDSKVSATSILGINDNNTEIKGRKRNIS